MKKAFIFSFLFLFGCTDSENAASNLQKGDEFLKRGEYEVAEYYYDKIPEESVLYKTVLRRKQELQKKMNSGATTSEGATSSGQKQQEGVKITNESHVLQLGRMPIHTITILNGTPKRLNVVEMDFVYLDDSGKEVARLLTMVSANVGPGEEKEIGKIMPGMVSEKFSRVKMEIKRTLLF
jgi:hypothetical protein